MRPPTAIFKEHRKGRVVRRHTYDLEGEDCLAVDEADDPADLGAAPLPEGIKGTQTIFEWVRPGRVEEPIPETLGSLITPTLSDHPDRWLVLNEGAIVPTPREVSAFRAERESPVLFPADRVSHLISDEPLISHLHEHEIPPEEYYVELQVQLLKQYPGATPELVEHVCALVKAFDIATVFCLSFGIKKFQLAQKQVQLVGEIVST